MEQARADEAGRRRSQAAERARELAALRSRLAAGDAVTLGDLKHAQQRAEESRVLADEAHGHAADAHHRAAMAHIAAAEMLELLEDGHDDGDSTLRAAAHRAAAQVDLGSERTDREERQHDPPGAAPEAPQPSAGTLGQDPTDEQGA